MDNVKNEKLWISYSAFEEFAKKELYKKYVEYCKNISEDDTLIEIVDKLFQMVVEMQKKEVKEAIRYIHFFFLGSSIITDCNEIQINLFSKESYMDKKEAMAIWNPDFILKYHMESVKSVDKLARQRVRGYSRQQYMQLKLWSHALYNLQIFNYLHRVAPEITELDSFKAMNKDSQICMAFGGYMDRAVSVWPVKDAMEDPL